MLEIKKNPFYRLLDKKENSYCDDPNIIYKAIREVYESTYEESIKSLFDDIHDKPVKILLDLYCPERYPVSDTPLNLIRKDEYVNNYFVQLLEGGRCERPDWSDVDSVRNKEPEFFSTLDNALIQEDLALKSLSLLARHITRAERMAHIDHITVSERFYILQGAIGCGKTTLTHYFIKVIMPLLAKGKQISQLFPIFIDYKNIQCDYNIRREEAKKEIAQMAFASFTENYPDFLTPETLKNISIDSDPIFQRILPSVGAGQPRHNMVLRDRMMYDKISHDYYKPTDQRVADILNYIVSKQIGLPILILDNIDHQPQWPQTTLLTSFYELVSEQWHSSMALVALREHTLSENRRWAEARHLNIMHITSPRASNLLKTRLNYIARNLEEGRKRIDFSQIFGREHIGLSISKCVHFLNSWADTLSNSEVEKFIRQFAGAHMRQLLQKVYSIISSRYRNNDDFIDYYLKQAPASRSPEVSLDDVMRFLMIGKRDYYESDLSEETEPNLFRLYKVPHDLSRTPQPTDPSLYTIQLRIMNLIIRGNEKGASKSDLMVLCKSLEFSEEQTASIIQRLMDLRFIESLEGRSAGESSQFVTTNRGKYFSQIFAFTCIYIENIIGDTYIDYEESLHEYDASLVKDFPRILRFIDFIRRMEVEELRKAKVAGSVQEQHCKTLMVTYPLCWSMLRSVCTHASNVKLWAHSNTHVILSDTKALRVQILDNIEKQELWSTKTRALLDQEFPEGKIWAFAE